MKILLTGATGFIGSAVLEPAVSRNHEKADGQRLRALGWQPRVALREDLQQLIQSQKP